MAERIQYGIGDRPDVKWGVGKRWQRMEFRERIESVADLMGRPAPVVLEYLDTNRFRRTALGVYSTRLPRPIGKA